MNTQHKRMILFLVVCLGLRSALAYTAYKTSEKYLYLFGIFGTLLVIGFLSAIIRNRSHGPEMLGDDPIWWKKWRYIHIIMWTIVAIAGFSRKKWVWIPMAVDVGIGLLAFILHYGFNIS